MKLTFEDHEQLSILKLDGDLTANEADEFRRMTLQRFDQQICDFVIDVSQVQFIDSKGLEAFLWLQERVVENLGQLRLVNMNEQLKTILKMTRLAGRFEVESDVESAIMSLR